MRWSRSTIAWPPAGHRARRLLRGHPRHQRHARPAGWHASPARRAVVRRHAPALLSQRPAARSRSRAARPRAGRKWRAAMQAIRRSGDGRTHGALLPLNEPHPLFALSLQQGPVLATATAAALFRAPFRRALDFYASLFRDDLAPADGGDAGRQRMGRIRPRPVRLLRHRSLEHRRVPASPPRRSARATGRRRPCRGPDGPGVSTAGGSSLVVFKHSDGRLRPGS
jgi:hypothetical protein